MRGQHFYRKENCAYLLRCILSEVVMKWLVAFVSVCALSTAVLAEPASQQLEQLITQAKALADKKAYGDAAAALEHPSAEITILAAWRDTFYLRARYQALAGKPDEALAALRAAVDHGTTPAADAVAKEVDFAAIRERPEFKGLMARLQKEAELWKDNPALATPYKLALSEEEKVAGLSKLWSEARFNFPFFGRIPEVDWDATYMAYLGQVRAANSTEDYYRVLARFLATLRDGHTRVIAPPELTNRFYSGAPLQTALVQGKVLVTAVSDPALTAQGVSAGAELLAINGRPTRDYVKNVIEPHVFGFTPQDRDHWRYDVDLLRGAVDEPLHLSFRLAKGKTVDAIVQRQKFDGYYGYFPKPKETARFAMLAGNIAYLKIGEFMDDAGVKALRENYAAIAGAKGFVIDLRDNPGGDDRNAGAILKILADKPFLTNSWKTREYVAAHRSWNKTIGWRRADAGYARPDPSLHLSVPVAVVINGGTYSSSEDFTVAFVSMQRGKLVGETTGGSTGNPVVFKLPGGGMAFICTKDDGFPDGRVLEGVGIAPDIEVKPTIADIRAGRDPVLERATSLLKQGR